MRRLAAFFVVVLGVLAGVTAAQASTTTVGQTGTPVNTGYWTGGFDDITPAYVVPAVGGTIVSLNTQSSTCDLQFFGHVQGTYNLQVLRPLGGGLYKVLGDTGNELDPCDSQLHSYPVNIPVQAGDILGAYVVSGWAGLLSGGQSPGAKISEPAVGATIGPFTFGAGFSLDESGTLNFQDSDLSLAQPSDVTVDATSPGGAIVTYTNPAATDEDLSTVTVSCVPASGSTFAIGDTTVTCTATDTDGDANSPVTKTFNVHVKGAAEQLADLANAVKGVGRPPPVLADRVASIQSDLAAGDTSDACGTLNAFIHDVEAQSGNSIPAGTASSLIAAAQQIEAVIGCGKQSRSKR